MTYAWDFNNDGKIDSNVKNPLYTYDKPGTYIASLTVTNVAGSATKQVTITVQPPTVKKRLRNSLRINISAEFP